jgi:DNA repair ATPase RecN
MPSESLKQRSSALPLCCVLGRASGTKAALIIDEKTYLQQLELLRFQASEIRDARLEAAEDEHQPGASRASNSARLPQLSQTALEVLSENETSLVNQAGVLGRTCRSWRGWTQGSRVRQTHEQCVSMLHELRKGLDDYAETVEIDPPGCSSYPLVWI